MTQFEHSYAALPQRFFAHVQPSPASQPRMLAFNRPLATELGLEPDRFDSPEGAAWLSGAEVHEAFRPIAMAYAGHQFGGFVPQLGDGRAMLVGEVIDSNGIRRDLQLKGAGRTPFSRGGDGRAALGPVLREYLVSEAMHALGIPTTRALAAVATGDIVWREAELQGAVLTRVAKSHIRVGTFQYFAARGDTEAIRLLADYAIERLYPELVSADHRYLALLDAVAGRQARLIARWMGVGFIHGVMNTDNSAISGETIDYGPCAFMDGYDPKTVFSSIDRNGRYQFQNQPGIAQWNLARLAETLLPLIDEDDEKAIEAANAAVVDFARRFQHFWLQTFAAKIGIDHPVAEDAVLIQDLLDIMAADGVDFTSAFLTLAGAESNPSNFTALFIDRPSIDTWMDRWRGRLVTESNTEADRAALMRRSNPRYIPRNHLVEEALAAAADGDMGPFNVLHDLLADPFGDRGPSFDRYTQPAPGGGPAYRTFCGT